MVVGGGGQGLLKTFLHYMVVPHYIHTIQATFMFSGVWHILVFWYNTRVVSARWCLFFVIQVRDGACALCMGILNLSLDGCAAALLCAAKRTACTPLNSILNACRRPLK